MSRERLRYYIEQYYNKSLDVLLKEMYYDQNMSMDKIAKELKISKNTLYKWFKEYNIRVKKLKWL